MPTSPKQRKMAILGSRSVGKPRERLLVVTRVSFRTVVLTTRRMTAGKSSLTVQLCEEHFVDSYYPTIENTFSKVIKARGSEYAMEIVDTAGTVSKPLSLAPIPWPPHNL